MAPVVNSKEHQERSKAQYIINSEASRHQPIHIVIVKSQYHIRAKIWTDEYPYVFEYGTHNKKFRGPDKREFEKWFERNVDAIEKMWDIVCNNMDIDDPEYTKGLD